MEGKKHEFSALTGQQMHSFPNLTISLDDINILNALTLNVLTSGYDMEEGSRPFAIIYRIYYRLMKTNLDPQAVIKNAS